MLSGNRGRQVRCAARDDHLDPAERTGGGAVGADCERAVGAGEGEQAGDDLTRRPVVAELRRNDGAHRTGRTDTLGLFTLTDAISATLARFGDEQDAVAVHQLDLARVVQAARENGRSFGAREPREHSILRSRLGGADTHS